MNIEVKLKQTETELRPNKDGKTYETGGIDRALIRLRKKMDREKRIDQVKDRRYYVKPSVKRKLARQKAKYIQKCRDAEE